MSTQLSVGVLEEQLAALRKLFPRASVESAEGGAVLVTIPDVPLPPGWSQASTTVRFLAPAGYPMARPDCFWADASLRLANGGNPQNGSPNPIPGRAEPQMWFSWHLQSWNPVTDTLVTFLRAIQRRFSMKN
jgi:hypothetical protein